MSAQRPDQDPGRPGGVLRADFARQAGLGVQFAATVGVLAWGGHWLDQRWHTSPLFLLVGVAAGFTGSIVSLIRQVPPTRGKEPATRRREGPPEDPPAA